MWGLPVWHKGQTLGVFWNWEYRGCSNMGWEEGCQQEDCWEVYLWSTWALRSSSSCAAKRLLPTQIYFLEQLSEGKDLYLGTSGPGKGEDKKVH